MQSDATTLLTLARSGDARAVDTLMPLVYDQLRAEAARLFQRERGSELQPTAIVHEAYLKLVDQERAQWQDSVHFRRVAASVMRRLLVDNARKRRSRKRGGDWERITLSTGLFGVQSKEIDVVELDDLIGRLGEADERAAAVVVYRVFGGLTIVETADVLEISTASVDRDWEFARTWLHRHLFPPTE